jgi:hypothetical protein
MALRTQGVYLMVMTTKEVLIAARAKIEQGWCQCYFAMDAEGNAVPSSDPAACRWCAVGALRSFIALGGENYYEARDRMERQHPQGLMHFNDIVADSKEQVLRLFDKAIAETPDDQN